MKKILTVLAPVFAIVAFMAIPAMAQATQVQCGGVECKEGEKIKGVATTNLTTTTQNPTKTIVCTSSLFEGTLGAPQGEDITGTLTKDTLGGCSLGGLTTDIATNASTTAPWTLQVQQPEAGTGQVTAHLSATGGMTFTAKVQIFGLVAATCVFEASSIQLMGEEKVDTLAVEGTNQFLLVSRSGSAAGECGTVGTTTGDLTGSFQTETNPGNAAVVVDMS